MITVQGTKEELTTVLKDLAPNYPAELIEHLEPGEWIFIRKGIAIALTIEEVKEFTLLKGKQFELHIEEEKK